MTIKLTSALSLGLLLLGPLAAPTVMASPEIDRQYALETVGFLRSWDNVDNLFASYVSEAYREYFVKQSRFLLQDLSKGSEVLTSSKIPYRKLIEDVELLGQLARSTRSQSIIRTKVLKEGSSYRFNIEWLHSPKMEKISEATFTLENVGDVKAQLHQALDAMIGKLPFVATLTGRDNNSVTVDIGSSSNLKPGDTLVVASLEDVKKHPLLKSIVEWQLVETGRVVIDSVDEGISFGRVTEELPGRQIGRFQKVTRIIPRPETAEEPKAIVETDEEKRIRALSAQPRMGWASGGLWTGSFSRQYSSLNNTQGTTGGGLFMGMKADAQVWLTREWFAELGFGYGFSGYSQSDISTGVESTGVGSTASAMTLRGDIGYTYFTTPDFFGPKGWVKLGYRTSSYSLATSTAGQTGPSTFKGLFLGVGGDLPVRQRYGALVSLDFGLLTDAESPGLSSGTLISSTDVSFFLGGYYRHTPRMTFKIGLDVMAHGADFSNGTTLTQKVISLGPSMLLYF